MKLDNHARAQSWRMKKMMTRIVLPTWKGKCDNRDVRGVVTDGEGGPECKADEDEEGKGSWQPILLHHAF